MFLDVVETKGEDLDDDLKEDFRPGLFFRFVFHNVVVLKIKQKCKMFFIWRHISPNGSLLRRIVLRANAP